LNNNKTSQTKSSGFTMSRKGSVCEIRCPVDTNRILSILRILSPSP
jgi:hypothetical protein